MDSYDQHTYRFKIITCYLIQETKNRDKVKPQK